ncbi:MAG: 5-formyltetrahydrofolate cyclo-ligase [Nitrososphaerales archaeon]
MSNEKQVLRDKMVNTRNSLSVEATERMSEIIQNRVIRMDEFVNAGAIAAYHPVGSEVSTLKILSTVLRLKKSLALPRVEDATAIIFAMVNDLKQDLENGRYKIKEPKKHCPRVNEIDLVLVPGIAWDEHGHRLGYGKGYYDRYLANLQTTTVGLAYDFQVLENIPHDQNDFRVDLIITEKRVIKI